MGGPSRESYRAAEAARQKRLDAMRTRDGVVDLAEWRAALPAMEFVRSTFGRFPLLLDVRLLPSRSVGFEVVVTLARDAREIRVCLPRAVNDVPVRIVVRNPERRSRPVSAPIVPSEP
jgi:hypothetical protein